MRALIFVIALCLPQVANAKFVDLVCEGEAKDIKDQTVHRTYDVSLDSDKEIGQARDRNPEEKLFKLSRSVVFRPQIVLFSMGAFDDMPVEEHIVIDRETLDFDVMLTLSGDMVKRGAGKCAVQNVKRVF